MCFHERVRTHQVTALQRVPCIHLPKTNCFHQTLREYRPNRHILKERFVHQELQNGYRLHILLKP